ncbi:hypothetical protein D3C71_1749510 [compost metagenome]
MLDTTKEQDMEAYLVLKDRNPETVDVIKLDPGRYSQDFNEGFLEKVDLQTKHLYFTYPDQTTPGGVIKPQLPLTEQIKTLEALQEQYKEALQGTSNDLQSLIDYLSEAGVI